MTKVLLILSALVMGASGFLAYQNGRKFKSVREDHFKLNTQLRTEKGALDSAIELVTKANGEIATLQKDIDTEGEKLKQNKLKIASLEADLKRVLDETKAKADRMAELEAKLRELPPGYNPQTLPEQINKLKQEIAEVQAQTEKKKEEVAAAEKKVADAHKALDDILAKIEARKKAFERNSMSGRVVAVNTDWGFVVLDVGAKEGISPDTKLIVIRGTQTVGKVNIIDVSGTRTVASILGETLAPGMSPAPGDRVILENLTQ